MRSRVAKILRRQPALWARTPHNPGVGIISSNSLEPQRPLRDIVVDGQPTVAHVTPQCRPLVACVSHRLPQRRLGQDPMGQFIQILLDPIEDRHRLELTQHLTLDGHEVPRRSSMS